MKWRTANNKRRNRDRKLWKGLAELHRRFGKSPVAHAYGKTPDDVRFVMTVKGPQPHRRRARYI